MPLDPECDAAFLRDICEHADDDTPRLIYADWLEENGEPLRAEFIRVQCRLHALTPDAPDYFDLQERDEELQFCLGASVSEAIPLPTLEHVTWESDLELERGFLSAVEVEATPEEGVEAIDGICDEVAEVVRQTPVRKVVLRWPSLEQTAALLESPILESFTALVLESGLQGDEADEKAHLVAASPRVRNLKELSLFSDVGDAGLSALAQSPHLAGLTTFNTCLRRITPAGARALARAPWFSRLRSLALYDSGVNDPCLEILCASGPCPQLHTLDLSHNRRIHAAGARALARSRAFPRLAHLDLSFTSLGPEGVATLAEARGWPLSELDLWGSRAGNAGMEALARSPLAATLRVLSLGNCGLGVRGVETLAASTMLVYLRQLDLALNPIGPRGLLALARSPYLKNLTSLSLFRLDNERRPLAAADIRAFLEALRLPKLRSLRLLELPVGARGAKALASAPLNNLTRLELNKCGIPDAGAEALVESPALRGLLSLDLSFNRIKTGVRRLADPKVLPRLVNCLVVGNPIERRLAAKLRKRFPFAV